MPCSDAAGYQRFRRSPRLVRNVTTFIVRHLHGSETKKTKENLRQLSRLLSPDSNTESSVCEADISLIHSDNQHSNLYLERLPCYSPLRLILH